MNFCETCYFSLKIEMFFDSLLINKCYTKNLRLKERKFSPVADSAWWILIKNIFVRFYLYFFTNFIKKEKVNIIKNRYWMV